MAEKKKKNAVRKVSGGVCAPKGFHAAGVHAGFKIKSKKKDLALIYSETMCSAAAAYTTNKVKGATLRVTMDHLADGKAQAVVVNSGYANTLAKDGMEIALRTCELAADALGLAAEDIVVCSTGVIGQPPQIGPFEKYVPKLAGVVKDAISVNTKPKASGAHPENKLAAADARHYGSSAAADAIMTTDTVRKEIAVEFSLGGKACRIGGIAKGSGMINPNMATMLAFITTDADIAPDALHEALKEDINHSFNQISIDGDTSTNDTVVVMANGMAGNRRITKAGRDFAAFADALNTVTVALARMLARDGEGATKLIECRVQGAPTDEIGMRIAKTVIQSDLVKTAIFGSDANWGRILCAVGYTPGAFGTDNVDVTLASRRGRVNVCKASFAVPFDEAKAKAVLGEDEVRILVNLHDGMAEAEAYGCDLTYGYVKINGMYRT
ncbi:MAG: bifunctional glutamate N-acetyltransferase/amino-acid acetyltransferase ArgJ [Clostridiales Family XIII bacterium]|jgi:glutamate N-acetyltransferase/amino-acid N-acetyltransferase|nr:bifunctional glutamate N-acetyltransferase/amino-acid acetyltransferase ArgJ [Clostridiales Family XIII bacterium]